MEVLGLFKRVALEEEDGEEEKEGMEVEEEEEEAAASNERVAACCDAGRACKRPLPLTLPFPLRPLSPLPALLQSLPFSSCLSGARACCGGCCWGPTLPCIRASSPIHSSPSATTTSMSAGSPPFLAC